MLARAAIPSHMMHQLAVFRRSTPISRHLTPSLAGCVLAAAAVLASCADNPKPAEPAASEPPSSSQVPAQSPAQAPAQIAVGEPNPSAPKPEPKPDRAPEAGQNGQSTPQPAAVDLAPKLVAGSFARYSVHAEGQETTEMTGAMAMRSDAKWDATLDVLVQIGERDAAGLTSATISLDRIRATDNLDGRAMHYDSAESPEKDPGNLVRPTIEPLVAKRIELTLDKHGQIVKTRLPDDLAKRHNPATRWTTRLLGDGDIQALFAPIFSTGVASRGSDDARVGDTWSSTRQEPFGTAGVTTTITHALTQTNAGSATIALNGDAALTPNDKIPAGLQRVTRQSFTGTTRWDLSRGWLAEHELGRETQVQVRPEPDGFSILKTQLVQVRRVD